MAEAIPRPDKLYKVVNDYYAAINRLDVTSASDLWKNPPPKLSGDIKKIDYIKVNDEKIVSAESYHAIVRVDYIGKTNDRGTSPRTQQVNIELEPVSLDKWAIVSIKPSSPKKSDWPKTTSTPTKVQDELVALVRQYCDALDHRNDDAALALWKKPSEKLRAQVKNTEYFKVNEVSFLSAESDHANVWVDVNSKSFRERSQNWIGSVELELNDKGKWNLVHMHLLPK